MPLEDRDRSIIAQNANNVASQVVAAAVQAGQIEIDKASNYLADIARDVQAITYTNIAEAGVTGNFPGTTVENTAQVIPHPATVQQVPNTPQAPPPIPGVQEDPDDALWRELVENPSNFWDNRTNKKNPKGPDFAHKTKKSPDGRFGAGLWLKDKPAWVNL